MTEEEYLKSYNKNLYEMPGVTVDDLLFTVINNKLSILLLKRTDFPYKDKWAIPGGFVDINESLDDASLRIVKEKTGINNLYLEQLYTWGDLNRDPRMRILSVSYMALCNYDDIKTLEHDNLQFASIDTTNKEINIIINGKNINNEMGFDHYNMVKYAVKRMQNKLFYTEIAFSFCRKKFTMLELQNVFEAILGQKLHTPNFRRDIAKQVRKIDELSTNKKGRPSAYYERVI